MKYIQHFLLAFILCLFASCVTPPNPESSFKRTPAKEVTPITIKNVRYSSGMNEIIATDTLTNEVVWTKEIYSIQFDENLERDVQEIYIDSLFTKDNSLYIRNEEGKMYTMNLKSHEINEIE